MPGTTAANAEFKKGLHYIVCSSIFAIPTCLDPWDKPAGRGNGTAALRKFG